MGGAARARRLEPDLRVPSLGAPHQRANAASAGCPVVSGRYVAPTVERFKSFGQFLLGLAILVLAGAGIWLLLKSLFSNAAVAGPVIAASVAISVFAGGEYFTRQRIAQQYRWDKVVDTYAKFLDLIRKIGNDERPPGLNEFMAQFNNDLPLWGSPKVITAWVEMNRQTEAGLDNNQAAMLQRDLLRAIRKDFGQLDRTLDDRDLMKLLVNDIDEHFDSGLVPKK